MSSLDSIPTEPLPLFSIENTVIFPHNTIPFHIFEDHYYDMISDALDKHGYLCFSTETARKTEDHNKRHFYSIGCLLKIIDYHRLEDRRYEILVESVSPVRLKEIEVDKSYQMVEFEILPQTFTNLSPEEQSQLQTKFLNHISKRITPENLELISPKIKAMPTVELINAMAYNCPGSVTTRQELLETTDLQDIIERLDDYYN